jgi:hypothetical protein
MFSGKKRKNKGKKEKKAKKKTDPLVNGVNISWWTPWRKIKTIALAAVLAATGAGLASYYLNPRGDWQTRERHEEHVAQEISLYDDYADSSKPSDMYVTLGSQGRIIRDSIVLMGFQSDEENITVKNLTKFDTEDEYDERPFIRPVDGGQDISIDSEVRIDGLDYSDLEGIISSRTSIKITPIIPDIFPHHFSIDLIAVNNKRIPLKYVEGTRPKSGSDRPQYSLDLRRLVDDDILSEEDFKGSVELTMSSFIEIDDVPTIYDGDVAGLFAYKAMPGHLKRYTESTGELPSDSRMIQKIVDEYEGDTFNVLDIITYALDKTMDALEYELKDEYIDLEDIVKSGKGDCEYYAALFTSILRGFGVPARLAEGSMANHDGSDFDGRHAWSEVLIPFKDGSYRWIHVEPTWADHDYEPYRFINFVDDSYLYSFDFNVELDTSNHSDVYYLFQNHKWSSIHSVDLDGEIEEGDQ